MPFPNDNGWIDRHPRTRPAATLSPTGEGRVRGRSVDSTVSDWELVSILFGAQPDTAPDPAALVERRFPIRRVFR